MRSIAATLSLLVLEACVHEQVLQPAAGASLAFTRRSASRRRTSPTPGRQDVAETTAAGVTVKVAGASWKGDPEHLGSLFAPIRVTIQNHSWKPLRVSYQDFSLSGASGFQYAAIPPIKARCTVSARNEPSSASSRPAEWEHDRLSNWPERRPPTQDMVSEALPEGVVEDGGSVAGIVYFESVTGRESAVELEMTLVDSSDGQTFGRIAIPFQTRQQAAQEESRRYAAAEEETAQHAATLQALDTLRNAEWMLATGNWDGVDGELANAEAALSGRTRLDLEAAREALANEDLYLARQYLAAALAERRAPR